MKKFIKIILAIIIIALIAYSVFWFQQAKNIEESFNNFVIDKKSESVQINYVSAEVKGFPLSHKLVIDKPKMSIDYSGILESDDIMEFVDKDPIKLQEFISDDKVVIEINSIKRFIGVRIPKELLFKETRDSGVTEELQYLSEEEAILKIGSNEFSYLGALFQEEFSGYLEKISKFGFISYSGGSSRVVDKKTNEILQSVDSFEGLIKIKELENNLTKYIVKGTSTGVSYDFSSAYEDKFNISPLSNLNSVVDIEIIAESDLGENVSISDIKDKAGNLSIKINKLYIQSNEISVKVNSDISFDDSDSAPVGYIDISLNNYPTILKQLSYFLANNLSAFLVAYELTEENINKAIVPIFSLIEQIKEPSKTINKNNALIKVKREKDSDFYIGNKTMPQVMMMGMQVMGQVTQELMPADQQLSEEQQIKE